jgi:hypothetical protein
MRFRLGRAADFSECGRLLVNDGGLELAPEMWAALPRIWKAMFDSWGRGTFVVYTDEDDSVYGFGMSAFVTDAFLQAEQANPRPYIAARFYQDFERVLLGVDDVREANTEERLNLLILHACHKNPDPSHPQTRRVMPIAAQSFLFAHAGYSIRALLGEVYGAEFAAFLEAGGYELVSDFPELEKQRRRPYLMKLDREQVPRGGSDLAMQLLYPQRPIFQFTIAEQRLLTHSLLGLTDRQLSDELAVSLETVRSTWDSIYTRVARVRPLLFAAPDEASTAAARGAEKRRQLLDYLRQHMEELRPATRASSAGRR